MKYHIIDIILNVVLALAVIFLMCVWFYIALNLAIIDDCQQGYRSGSICEKTK